MDLEPRDVDSYDIAPTMPAAPPAPKAQPIRAKSLSYQSPTKPAATDTETLKNLYIPLWLLTAGVLIESIAAAWKYGARTGGIYVLIDLVLSTALIYGGMAVAGKARGFKLGAFGSALLRVAALSVGPSAAFLLFNPLLEDIPFGTLVGLIGEFILYFALLGLLFDLDESDTWYCIWVIFFLRLGIYFLAQWLLK